MSKSLVCMHTLSSARKRPDFEQTTSSTSRSGSSTGDAPAVFHVMTRFPFVTCYNIYAYNELIHNKFRVRAHTAAPTPADSRSTIFCKPLHLATSDRGCGEVLSGREKKDPRPHR